MWEYADKQLKEFNNQYYKQNKQTLDEFQNIFDSTNVDLNKNASKNDLERFKRRINNNYEYLSDYGKYKAKKYLKMRRIKYSDILLFSIFMAYAYEQYVLLPLEMKVFKNVSNNIYEDIIKEFPKKKKINIDNLVNSLISQPNSKGYIWQDYNDAMCEYNAEELYRQAVLNIKSNKPLNINSKELKKIINRQHNRLISIKDGKTSGAMDNETIGIANSVKLETYSILGVKKCRFIAVEDKVTTRMCKSLDGQIFNVHDWNEFKRYSATNDTIVKYRVYGMILGVNLPPIDDHFHYCRSTITYQVNDDRD